MSDEKNIQDNPEEDEVLDAPLAAEGGTDTDMAVPENSRGADALRDLMEYNYMVYASYVIKERAIPDVDDGLKPVQRRILHTLYTIDDGRMHKVNSVVGEAMKYHPHGDASIGDALVVLANKDYFIDRQGNFGNIFTGDPAAAGRYIECRLNKFGREVLFNPAVTEYIDSYDGRNQEPLVLPSKVPTLLMMGSDGIAVGMATHVFPHNFVELLQAEIAILKGEPFQLYPDFPTGGLMDASEYADGLGDIKVRARIEADGDKKVIIREVPANSTTDSLIASIERAAKAGKLKMAAINDYTASEVDIEISLARGVYADETIRELYAYTDCQKVLHSTILVIQDNLPVEMTVSQVLHRNVEKLRGILKAELDLELHNEIEALQRLSLERIFIENRIYKRIEKCVSLPKIVEAVRTGLEPFRAQLQRDVTDDDITHLLQIPIRRISLFDLNKNQDDITAVSQAKAKTEYNLEHQVEYAIGYIQGLIDKYGALYPRRTQITGIENVDRKDVARRDIKVYHDRVNFFIGTGVKSSSKDAMPLVCSEFDRLMLLRSDGNCQVIPISNKTYVGQTKYVFVYDKDQIFSILYRDKKEGTWYVKRFQLGQFILLKEYHIIPEGCIIEALYTNSGVVVSLELATNRRRAYNDIRVEFASYPLRGREARGFKVTHYPVVKVNVLERGSEGPVLSENSADSGASEDVSGDVSAPIAAGDVVGDVVTSPVEMVDSTVAEEASAADMPAEQPLEEAVSAEKPEPVKKQKKTKASKIEIPSMASPGEDDGAKEVVEKIESTSANNDTTADVAQGAQEKIEDSPAECKDQGMPEESDKTKDPGDSSAKPKFHQDDLPFFL